MVGCDILRRYVVGVVFGFEHILLVLAVLLQHIVHPVPKWVRILGEHTSLGREPSLQPPLPTYLQGSQRRRQAKLEYAIKHCNKLFCFYSQELMS